MRLNLLSDPPVLEFENKIFPVSKEIKRMFVLPVIIAKKKEKVLATVQDESETWHRRLGHCNVRTLKQLAERQGSGIKLSANIQNLDCQVCAVSKNKKISHPRSDRPRSSRRLEVVHADLWGPHTTESYTKCKYLIMFTDDMSRMRWIYALKSKDEAVGALEEFIKRRSGPRGALHWPNRV